MRTPEEIEAFYLLLEMAYIARSNRLAHRALDHYQRGGDAQTCVNVAAAQETNNRISWITSYLDPWCQRHGLTREQGLSVTFDDGPYNPANPKQDQITMPDVLMGQGQHHGHVAFSLCSTAPVTAPEPAVPLTLGQRLMAAVAQEHERQEAVNQRVDTAPSDEEILDAVTNLFCLMQEKVSIQILNGSTTVEVSLKPGQLFLGEDFSLCILGLVGRLDSPNFYKPDNEFYPLATKFFRWAKDQHLYVKFERRSDCDALFWHVLVVTTL
jgi:hypothetical protein